MTYGDVTDEALQLIWLARDEARARLSEEIVIYTQKLLDLAVDANSLRRVTDTSPTSQERNSKLDKLYKILDEFITLKPHETYRKYLADH